MSNYEFLATHPGASAIDASCDYGRYLLGAIAYQDKLYWGYGNWHKASCEDEVGMGVYAFDPSDNSFINEFDAQTESIYDYRVLSDGNLYIPHIDPHSLDEGMFTGKAYSKRVGGVWSDIDADIYHVFDIQELGGNMYLIGSIDNPGVGLVLESLDGGATFSPILTQSYSGATTRCFFGFVWDDELYVQADRLTTCQIYDGTVWRAGPHLLPSGGDGYFTNHFANRVAYMSKDRGQSGKLYAWNGATAAVVKSNIVKYCIYGSKLYAIKIDGTLQSTTNYTNWQTLAQFTDAQPTCMVGYGNKLYIGTANSKIYRSLFTI